MLLYTTGGRDERYYKSTRVGVKRISRDEYNNRTSNLGKTQPKVGDKVTIIVKPYRANKCHTGLVRDVLTKRKTHTRGHKVRLESGIVGRTLKIHNK